MGVGIEYYFCFFFSPAIPSVRLEAQNLVWKIAARSHVPWIKRHTDAPKPSCCATWGFIQIV